MPEAILFTQCLQNDFVKPIGKDERLPNLLHVGYEEARRLMGENPSQGPIARVMNWAHSQPPEKLHIIHIRDWHSLLDASQFAHNKRFGNHCLENTEGAAFAFEQKTEAQRNITVINALSLNDFQETALKSHLELFTNKKVKVGLVGVWTEAKITFLAYELATRYPGFTLAVCSALTASSSRSAHFIALDQLEKLLGVKVYSSVGHFIEFLGGNHNEIPLIGFSEKHPEIIIKNETEQLSDTDRTLLRYLFRDCRSAEFSKLTGGFSGNLVLGSKSLDLYGHEQVPHVLKVGGRDQLGQERTAFERIEAVLGNNAPRITDFADLNDRGAIKYRYASMDGFATTFQKLFSAATSFQEIINILSIVFSEQLGRLYAAGKSEKSNLLEHYSFDSKWASHVRKRVEALLNKPANDHLIEFPGGRKAPNVCEFYETWLDKIPKTLVDSVYFSYVHGDLNGANIIIDGHQNVWIIDFFHTHRGHILKDLIKIENDILYIFTQINNQEEFDQALFLTDLLIDSEYIDGPFPEASATGIHAKQILKAYETVRFLRSLYSKLVHEFRDPFQVFVGKMRYAIHTLAFNESSEWQKMWALYTGSLCGEKIIKRYK